MADVLLREPKLRVQRSVDFSPQAAIPSFYPANDPSPPLETVLHPIAVTIPMAAFAWFILSTWIGFGGGEASLVLAVVTFLGLMYFSLLVVGAAFARDAGIGRTTRRTFSEFLDGDVEIATGRITGREALEKIAALPIALAVGASVIISIAVMART